MTGIGMDILALLLFCWAIHVPFVATRAEETAASIAAILLHRRVMAR